MRQYSVESGIQVIDRAVLIIEALSAEPLSLNDLCDATQLPRATTHRLATALEVHHILARDNDGRWNIGPWLTSFSTPARNRLIETAFPIMTEVMNTTGESVQLYQLTGTTRTCIATAEPSAGLRHTVPVGSQLPLTSGSAAKVFVAFADRHTQEEVLAAASYPAAELASVRKDHLAESVSEREVGLASLSAPVLGSDGELVAVLSISGPADRLKPSPAKTWGLELREAASSVSAAIAAS